MSIDSTSIMTAEYRTNDCKLFHRGRFSSLSREGVVILYLIRELVLQ